MYIKRGMDTEDVIHTYNRIFLSHRKELSNVIGSNMDGPRDYPMKVNKSNRERQMYDIAYMWNLKNRKKMNLLRQQKQTHRHKKQSFFSLLFLKIFLPCCVGFCHTKKGC